MADDEPDDARGQGISSHHIDLICPNDLGLNSEI